VAAIFTVVNVAGAVMAALQSEAIHTGVHVLLSLIGAFFVWRLAPLRSAIGVEPDVEYHPSTAASPTPPELTNRLAHLEHAVDAVAIEVERIGEGQRFITRSFVDREQVPARGEGLTEPTDTKSAGSGEREQRS
jgi:hypothetical protein